MEISGFLSSANASGQFSSASRADLQPVEDSKKNEAPHRHHGHRHGSRHGHALDVFRQEMRITLKAHFHARFAVAQQSYAAVRDPASPDDVADEALGAAKQLVAESPVQAAKSLVSFRAKVQETASYVRETVGVNDDVEDVDKAVARLGEGLDDLEEDVARNRESQASVLAVDTRMKQRSTIKIRTQEGDVVKLSLKRRDSLSAMDVAVSNSNGSATSTEVEVSSRSHMILKVEGDLNESELAAIQNVFAQAEQIANDFFGGDMAKAFSLAEGFEFDTEQLARVNMRFRMRQVTSISYAETVSPAQLAPVSGPAAMAPESAPAATAAAEPVSDAPVSIAAPAVAPVDSEQAVESNASDAAKPSPPDTSSALSDFLDSLGAFLRSVGEGFSAAESGASFTYHYSQSFKLSLLNSVIHTMAPEESGDAAANAGSLIEEIGE